MTFIKNGSNWPQINQKYSKIIQPTSNTSLWIWMKSIKLYLWVVVPNIIQISCQCNMTFQTILKRLWKNMNLVKNGMKKSITSNQIQTVSKTDFFLKSGMKILMKFLSLCPIFLRQPLEIASIFHLSAKSYHNISIPWG